MSEDSNKFLQFELWKACRNGCNFCTLLGMKDIDKNKSLDFALNALVLEENKEFDNIGFIGGEFFDNQLEDVVIRNKFYKLFDICKEKIDRGEVKRIFITSCLIFDIEKYFLPFFDYLNDKLNILDKVMLCTSYDTKYRFKKKESLSIWKSNMKLINNRYKNLHVHTQIILTQFFINDVMNGNLDLLKFCKEYNTFIDYNEPQVGPNFKSKKEMNEKIPDFFPTKLSFLKFLENIVLKQKIINPKTLLIRDLHCDKLYYSINNEIKCLRNRHKKENYYVKVEGTCNNNIGFIDSDLKMSDFTYMLMENL